MTEIIPDNLKVLIDLFTKNNHKLYIVGGACRDYLLNLNPKDFDLTTPLNPKSLKSFLSKNKVVFKETTHGVFLIDDFELVSFRDESKCKNRKDIPEYNGSLQEDYLRRDFTINSFYYDLISNEMLTFDCLDHIQNKKIVFNRLQSESIRFDRSRILRGMKYAYKLGFSFDYDSTLHYHSWDDIKHFFNYHIELGFFLYLHSNHPRFFNKIFKNINKETSLRLLKIVDFLSDETNNLLKTELTYTDLIYLTEPSRIPLKNQGKENSKNEIYFLIEQVRKNNKDNFTKLFQLLNSNPNYKIELKAVNFIKEDKLIEKILNFTLDNTIKHNLIKQGYKGRAISDKFNDLEYKRFRETL